MDIKQKAILVASVFLLVSLITFTAIKVFGTNDANLSEAVKIEQAVEAKPAPAPVKQIVPAVIEAQSPDVPKTSNEGHGFLYVIFAFLTIALVASIFLIIHLLKWRYRVSDTQVSVVPNELLKILEDQVGGFNQNAHYISEYIKRVVQDREKTDVGILELQKAFAIFQDSLNKKDKEIERYKDGYDSAIYKKFLGKFTKFYIQLKKEADAPENTQSADILKDMLEQLEDALLECNVALKTPALMQSADEYREIISGNKKIQVTNKPELHGKIAEVLMPAFVLRTQAGEEVLREANVAVYVYEESEAA